MLTHKILKTHASVPCNDSNLRRFNGGTLERSLLFADKRGSADVSGAVLRAFERVGRRTRILPPLSKWRLGLATGLGKAGDLLSDMLGSAAAKKMFRIGKRK